MLNKNCNYELIILCYYVYKDIMIFKKNIYFRYQHYKMQLKQTIQWHKL